MTTTKTAERTEGAERDVETRTNPEPDIDPPELPVSESLTPEERDTRYQALVAAEVQAGEGLVTLPQPVPVQRDDTPGNPNEPTLVWFQGLEPVGVGPEPPAEGGGAATGGTAGTPGSWTPAGATPPLNAADANTRGIVANPSTEWANGQYIVGGSGDIAWDVSMPEWFDGRYNAGPARKA